MKTPFIHGPLRTASILLVLGVFPSSAQTQSNPIPTPQTQFQQMESTYQAELRKIHVPLLSSYVDELKRLAAQSKTAEVTVAIENELQRIQGVISSGGVIDLNELMASIKAGGKKPASWPPNPSSVPSIPSIPRAVIVLNPERATSITPDRDPTLSAPQPLTSAEWAVETLAAGNYVVVMQYAFPALTTNPAVLRISFDEHQIELPMREHLVTGSPDSYRISRIGEFKLDADVSDATLELVLVGEKPLPALTVRHLAVLRPPQGGKPQPPRD